LLWLIPVASSGEAWIRSPQAPTYFAVDVADVDVAVEWYTRAFGVSLVDDNTADDGRWRIANLASASVAIEIIYDRRSSALDDGARVHGLRKLGVAVPDVRVIADRVESDTGDLPEVIEFEEHSIRLIQLRDPEGNVIQLHSPLQVDRSDEAVLLEMHRDVLLYHISGDIESWLATESDQYVSANRGEISYPTIEERRARLKPYLDATTFHEYRDVVEPVVRVYDDGSLGWVICEVQMLGEQNGEEISGAWAWVELYANDGDGWLRVGNVSNRR
jgi:predicted enzyme related to lactoylglutathione lyase